jgi:hypothetical protein
MGGGLVTLCAPPAGYTLGTIEDEVHRATQPQSCPNVGCERPMPHEHTAEGPFDAREGDDDDWSTRAAIAAGR